MSQQIMFMGDTHGYKNSYVRTLTLAQELGIHHVFQMGDCGTFPEDEPAWTQEHLETVNEFSRKHNIINYWIRGNHDDTDMWQAIIDNFPASKRMGYLRSNIRLTPRVGYFKMFGLQFLGVGGAVSIDAAYRRKLENWPGGYVDDGGFRGKGKGPKTLWWPDEAISHEDVAKVTDRKVDILMSHECSNHTPFRGRFKPDPDSEDSRRRLDEVIVKSRPDFHFHGHMHTQYDWENYLIHHMNHSTRTLGLECNGESMYNKREDNNFVLFDIETKQVTWKSEL